MSKQKQAAGTTMVVGGIIIAIAALALAGTMDAQDADNSHRQYCEMVALWGKDAESGIAPEQRVGWPPFDGRDKCNKE